MLFGRLNMNKTGSEDMIYTSRSMKVLRVLVIVIVAFALGYFLAREGSVDHKPGSQIGLSVRSEHETKKAEIWTCSMHPQIKLPNPGKCPICYMDLIPLESEDVAHDDTGTVRYTMSETAKKLAEVETTEVKRERASVTVRMVGLVYEDETRVAALTSRVDGRLDEVYINFTGVRVNKGDPMVTIWSPTLIKSPPISAGPII
jgi:Cu(I)/Ag(I) efflux system membrane fusion protein